MVDKASLCTDQTLIFCLPMAGNKSQHSLSGPSEVPHPPSLRQYVASRMPPAEREDKNSSTPSALSKEVSTNILLPFCLCPIFTSLNLLSSRKMEQTFRVISFLNLHEMREVVCLTLSLASWWLLERVPLYIPARYLSVTSSFNPNCIVRFISK